MESKEIHHQEEKPIGFAPPFIREEAIHAVERVLRSGWITTGPETAAFEKELAAFCGVSHAVCGGSWTALTGVILDWFGVGEGDEVILPAYTYCATANVVLHRGATPVLVDLPDRAHQDGLNVRWDDIEPLLTANTKIVMPVDIGGWPVPAGQWRSLLEGAYTSRSFNANTPVQSNLGRPLLVLDAAHSLGAETQGQPVGCGADVSVFSFHAVKNLTTAEGGAMALNLPAPFTGDALHRELRSRCLHGQSKDAAAKFAGSGQRAWHYDVTVPGFKCNMTDIQAALGRVALKHYPEDLTTRRALADRYDAGFEGWTKAVLPKRNAAGRVSADHLYALRIPSLREAQRDALIEGLSAEGIATNVHFQPLPLLTAYASRGFDPLDFPRAMEAYASEISLPLHLHLTLTDVDRIVAAVKRLTEALLTDA